MALNAGASDPRAAASSIVLSLLSPTIMFALSPKKIPKCVFARSTTMMSPDNFASLSQRKSQVSIVKPRFSRLYFSDHR